MATDPRGQILKTSSRLDGMSTVVVDNGPAKTLSFHCRTEDLAALLEADPRLLWEHMMTRKPGHFRTKRSK